MPPKTTFAKNDVIRAAMSIVTAQGLDALSIRKTAEKLGSSQAPVYSCFKSKYELEMEVRRKIKNLLMTRYTSKQYTESYPLNMAIGFVLFARDYSQLFKSLFLKRTDFKTIFKEFNRYHIAGMEKDKRFFHMPVKERKTLLSHLWIFTYGFATLANTGLVKKNDSYVIQTLREVGSVIVKAAIAKGSKSGKHISGDA